jgi:GNAT acetyltransferase-like protein
MELVRLPGRPANWDALIRSYEDKTLFHESCWLDHVLDIHPGSRIDYFVIRDGGADVGHFCAHRVRKLGLPIYGSPLPGTGTNYMGPLTCSGVDRRALVRAILRACWRNGVAHLELSAAWLDEDVARSSGLAVDRVGTHLVPLPPTEAEAWASMKSTARNRVKKANGAGLVAEVTTDPAVVDEFFAQLGEVFGKQGMAPPYSIERPRSLFRHLIGADRLLAVRVRNDGEVVAAGLFPHDERCIYFWGAGSWLKSQHLCPNELLQWTVIRSAVELGIPLYDMCGARSQFKDKFGGSDVPYHLCSRSLIPLLSPARRAYRRLHWWRLRFRGALRARGMTVGEATPSTWGTTSLPDPTGVATRTTSTSEQSERSANARGIQ